MPNDNALAIVEVENVTKDFGNMRAHRKRRPAVDGVSLTIDHATRLGIVGESGSGKSTLSRLIVGLETPTSGRVAYRGLNVHLMTPSVMREFRKNVQMISQDTSSSFDPTRTLRDSVRGPRRSFWEWTSPRRTHSWTRPLRWLASRRGWWTASPLTSPAASVSASPSRGRWSSSRALILCDEVVSALDVSVQGTVLNLLKKYCDENEAGLIFVSHGLPATAFVSKDIVVMRNGVIVEQGSVDDVIHHSKNLYTKTLIDAYKGSARPLISKPVVGGPLLEGSVR